MIRVERLLSYTMRFLKFLTDFINDNIFSARVLKGLTGYRQFDRLRRCFGEG